MKKLLLVFAVAALATACNSSSDKKTEEKTDTVVNTMSDTTSNMMQDTGAKMMDTTASKDTTRH